MPVRQVPTSLPRNTRAKSETSKGDSRPNTPMMESRDPGNAQFSSHVSFKDSFTLKETVFPKPGFS